ncbi:MAG TPA: SRPBCC family protein [Caulobacteraceae bacterium]
MTPLRTVIAAVGAALLLGAWSPTPEAVTAAQSGKVWLDVRSDPNSSAQLGRAVVDIDAPPAVVWKLMTDCAAIRRIMPSNRGCKVVSRKGNSEVVEQIINTPIMPDLHTVFRQDFEPGKRILITRVDGDLKIINGEWRLQALPGGGSRVSQEMRMQPAFPAPGMMVRTFLRNELSVGLANLRAEAEAAAKT